METKEAKRHWENIYETTAVEETGWYEETPGPSLRLIEECGLSADDRVTDVGSGASTLIDELVRRSFRDITAVDISEKALSELEKRLTRNGLKEHVRLLADDVSNPDKLLDLPPFALWHDRALLHFLKTEEERQNYAGTVQRMVRPGGYAIFAEFSPDGVDSCSGLKVQKYDESQLSKLLGDDFELKKKFHHVYETPSGGERPYIYTLFQRRG